MSYRRAVGWLISLFRVVLREDCLSTVPMHTTYIYNKVKSDVGMGEKGGVVGGKIILQVAGHDELEKERNASIFTFVTNRFSMSYR